ncbi:elongator complex protein 6 [Humulus lupulus]|uniref:elongator complex protein 6 n=1 Tax=Humulus lupulus TaxID=3486 RepID=UPI002B400AC2|nr:elongator complex protein 6 [Humulus lupulus]XP_062077390.1 elongator complex protein 6 [Humulus lupulus]
MEHGASSTLLDEAVGSLAGRLLLLHDSVETTAAFLLHHFLKRCLSPHSLNAVVFISFAHPFSHYDRILRKLGCNLAAQRDNNRFFFFDMLMWECPDEAEEEKRRSALVTLFGKIQKVISALPQERKSSVTIMIDDISLMEVAARGSMNLVIDFLHYCHTLTSELGCSLVALNHEDIYSSTERPTLVLQMEYLAGILIKAEPLTTGLAKDVHGQLKVLNRGTYDGAESKDRIHNFHFKVKENCVELFFPGSRT